MSDNVRTAETTVCLALSRDEIRTLISDNTALVQGLFRMLAGGPQAAERLVMKGQAAAGVARLPAAPLRSIEKILVLQKVPVFADITADEMRHLAAIAHEVPQDEGSTLFTESDPPAMWAVLSGAVSLESPAGEPLATAEPGDALGVHETLAGTSIGRRAVVRRTARALRIDREELFDLLEQRPELLQQMFSALFRAPAGTAGRLDAHVAAG
jgi:CRP-like cAMP-binding protein